MKFIILRNSTLYEEEKCPYKGSKQEEYLKEDRRTFKTPEEHDERSPKQPWLSEGINHKIIESGIIRYFPDKAWFLEINSIEELLQIAKEEDCELTITNKSWYSSVHPQIMIED